MNYAQHMGETMTEKKDVIENYTTMTKEQREKLFSEWTKPVPKPVQK
jgi:hypothetical protein